MVCARCPVRAVTAERPARVAPLGRVFHQVGPCELLDTTPDTPTRGSKPWPVGGTSGLVRGTPHRLPSRYATSCAPAWCKSASLTIQ